MEQSKYIASTIYIVDTIKTEIFSTDGHTKKFNFADFNDISTTSMDSLLNMLMFLFWVTKAFITFKPFTCSVIKATKLESLMLSFWVRGLWKYYNNKRNTN